MDTVSSHDGTTIAYDKVGEGPALILVDGAMSVHSSGATNNKRRGVRLGEHRQYAPPKHPLHARDRTTARQQCIMPRARPAVGLPEPFVRGIEPT